MNDSTTASDLLKFVDFAADSIKSVLVRPTKQKRVNRRRYLQRQVNRYKEQLLLRKEIKPAQTILRQKPFRARKLPASLFSDHQRNPLLDCTLRPSGCSAESFEQLPLLSVSSAEGPDANCCSCLYQNDSKDLNINDYNEQFVPSVSLESLTGLREWDYIDSITSTQNVIQKRTS